MIIQWMQEGVGEYRATWQGIALSLKYQPLCRRWWLWMTEGRTRNAAGEIAERGVTVRAGQGARLLQWVDTRGAKEYIDGIAMKVIREKQHPAAAQSSARDPRTGHFVSTKAVVGNSREGKTAEQDLRAAVAKTLKAAQKPALIVTPVPETKAKPRVHRKPTPVRKLASK
jgi:hypothetical protein